MRSQVRAVVGRADYSGDRFPSASTEQPKKLEYAPPAEPHLFTHFELECQNLELNAARSVVKFYASQTDLAP